MSENQNSVREKSKIGLKKTLLISCGILVIAVITMVVIFSTEPSAKRETATKETAMLVEVVEVREGDYYPTLFATGTVEPSQDIILSPRVSGRVIRLSDSFTPGGFVREGEILLQIDPADYENIVEQRKSDLSQAVSDLNIELGRQTVAEKDYQLFKETLPKENEELVLRKPQLEAAKSRVEAARAALKQAQLDLERTIVRSPFNSHILTRNVNVGSQVSAGENLGRLVGMENYWIVTTVPLSKVRWLTFSDSKNSNGSEVLVKNRTAGDGEDYRSGYLFKLVGALDDQTRLARVLVNIPDPLSYRNDTLNISPLMIGSFVETKIKGKLIKNVVRLNRNYLRKDNTVWVMKDGKLEMRDVKILLEDSKFAYISNGLSEGEYVVTTNLSTVTEGAKLRVKNGSAMTSQDTTTITARNFTDGSESGELISE